MPDPSTWDHARNRRTVQLACSSEVRSETSTRRDMAALRPPGGGDPVTDCTGAELKDGSLVEDDTFGQGFARGLVACVGGGFNVLPSRF